MMKKLVLLFTVILLTFISSNAQTNAGDKSRQHENMKKEITDFKIKFLAQEMQLNDDQQKKFNTLYRQMSDEKHKIWHELRAMKKNLGKKATNAEYEAYTKASADAKEKEAEIERRYDSRFSEFLSAKQIYQMKAAEEKFRQKMHEMRGKKKDKKH